MKSIEKQYRTVMIGLGNRGCAQLGCFLQLPDRFSVEGICDMDGGRVKAAAEKYHIAEEKQYTDVDDMLRKVRPDVMAFATMPDIRIELVKKAADYHVRGLIFEKPMANSLEEAWEMRQICRDNKIKAIVCHQHKYLPSFRRLKQCLEEGHIGKVYKITAECQSQMAHIATHYIDYILWANSNARAESVVGHVHGSSSLKGTHPSPDYALGHIVMENGVRATLECGYMTERHQEHMVDYEKDIYTEEYWSDCRLTVYGEQGYVYAGCNGQYGEFSMATEGKLETAKYGDFFKDTDSQVYFTKDFADWMEDDGRIHSCNVEQAYTGFEIFEAIYLSALEHVRVDLPLQLPLKEELIERMKREVPDIERKRFVK